MKNDDPDAPAIPLVELACALSLGAVSSLDLI
jgi:hypothetical protein